jgi:tetratricopeptide (TPR) repeat protein
MNLRLAPIAASLALAAAVQLHAQTSPVRLALPEHPGLFALDQGQWKIEDFLTKTRGNELTVLATEGEVHLRARLQLVPDQSQRTAVACRDEALAMEGVKPAQFHADATPTKSATGAVVAVVTMLGKDGQPTALRAFVGANALCGEMRFESSPPALSMQPLSIATLRAELAGIRFEPLTPATFRDAFAYATAARDHEDLEGAARAYRTALRLTDTSDDPLKWRRITTDQLSVALGLEGDITGSRAVNRAAIKLDPDYPMYYYNLACADAEESNIGDTQKHLKQAFDLRANVLPGETMPNPATDDSFQLFMEDPAFADFVKSLTAPPQPTSAAPPPAA